MPGVCLFVCLFFCLSVCWQLYVETTERIFTKILPRGAVGIRIGLAIERWWVRVSAGNAA